MVKLFISELIGIEFKIWRVAFFKFYTFKILEWTSGFHAIDDLPHVHGDEMDFRQRTEQ